MDMLPFSRLLTYANVIDNRPQYRYSFENNTIVSTGRNNGNITGGSFMTVPVNGYTTGYSAGSLSLSPNILLATSDYVLEATYYLNTTANGYSTVVTMSNNTGFRYGDSGYGNRLQYATDASGQQGVFSVSETRSSTYQKVMKVRWEKSNKVSKFFVNGVQTNMAIGVSTTYSNSQVNDTYSIPNITSLNLGATNLALISFSLDYK